MFMKDTGYNLLLFYAEQFTVLVVCCEKSPVTVIFNRNTTEKTYIVYILLIKVFLEEIKHCMKIHMYTKRGVIHLMSMNQDDLPNLNHTHEVGNLLFIYT
jgi:hypothetical protein